MNAGRFLRGVSHALNAMIACTAAHASTSLAPFEGKWIQNDRIRAFVADSPHPRILALGTVAGGTALLGPAAGLRSGVRLIAVEIDGRSQVEFPFDEEARWLSSTETSATLEMFSGAGPDRLRLVVEVRIPVDGAALHFSCSLTSESLRPRTLALWAIASLEPKGWILTPLSRGFEDGRWVHGKVVAYWTSTLNAPCLQMGAESLSIDAGRWPGSPDLKYGTRSNAGWIAALRSDLSSLLVASAPYAPADVFPDEDCNFTIWLGTHPDSSRYMEMEWLGPWTPVQRGVDMEWKFSLACESLPGEPPADAEEAFALVLSRRTHAANSLAPEGKSIWQLSAATSHLRDRFGRVSRWMAEGQTIASTPFWANSPVWNPAGSFRWDGGTFVEVDPASLPPWTGSGRTWSVDFSPDKDQFPAMLFLEGDLEAGVCLLLTVTELTAWIWTGGGAGVESLSVPRPKEGRIHVDLTYATSPGKLSLAVNGQAPQERLLPFRLKSVAPSLALGRPAGMPREVAVAPVASFAGELFRFSISSPVLP
jgi:hypothetical protein